jgi:hypothetical protein
VEIDNVHERTIVGPSSVVAALLRSLGSADDRLWPIHDWPALRLAGGLIPGAPGGHGPIAYRVEQVSDERVQFRLLPMRGLGRGLVGWHGFDLRPSATGVVLRHVLAARAQGWMRVKWPLLIRPLHDALIEDALDCAAGACEGAPRTQRRWSLWVRLLRWCLHAPTSRARRFDETALRFRRLLGGADHRNPPCAARRGPA